MSYILDALKKSEQDRERGSIPDIQSMHTSTAEFAPGNSILWPVALSVLGVFLVIAALFGAWRYLEKPNFITAMFTQETAEKLDVEGTPSSATQAPNHQALQQPNELLAQNNLNGTAREVPSSSTKTQKGNEIPAQLETKLTVKKVTKSKTASKTKTKSTNPPTVQKSTKLPATKTTKAKQQRPTVIFSKVPLDIAPSDTVIEAGNQLSSQDVPEVLITEEVGDAPKKGEVVNISDLPDSIRKELPPLSFSGHVYSTSSKQRSVMLNGKKMREGQVVSGDLNLKEITLTGAVFSYQGYLFSLGALQDWSFE